MDEAIIRNGWTRWIASGAGILLASPIIAWLCWHSEAVQQFQRTGQHTGPVLSLLVLLMFFPAFLGICLLVTGIVKAVWGETSDEEALDWLTG